MSTLIETVKHFAQKNNWDIVFDKGHVIQFRRDKSFIEFYAANFLIIWAGKSYINEDKSLIRYTHSNHQHIIATIFKKGTMNWGKSMETLIK